MQLNFFGFFIPYITYGVSKPEGLAIDPTVIISIHSESLFESIYACLSICPFWSCAQVILVKFAKPMCFDSSMNAVENSSDRTISSNISHITPYCEKSLHEKL